MNKKELGKWGEEEAKRFLIKKGYKEVTTNWRNRFGEIDLIMNDNSTIVFVEVRTKSNSTYGYGYESINIRKQQQLVKMANIFLEYKKWWDTPVRFDIISIDKIDGEFHISHFENVIN